MTLKMECVILIINLFLLNELISPNELTRDNRTNITLYLNLFNKINYYVDDLSEEMMKQIANYQSRKDQYLELK